MDYPQPGRELDTVVAEKVMGMADVLSKAKDQKEYELIRRKISNCPEYSTDIAAAWDVIEKINSLNKSTRDFVLHREQCGNYPDLKWKWMAWFRKDRMDENVDFNEWAETAPWAICLAALRVVEAG